MPVELPLEVPPASKTFSLPLGVVLLPLEVALAVVSTCSLTCLETNKSLGATGDPCSIPSPPEFPWPLTLQKHKPHKDITLAKL